MFPKDAQKEIRSEIKYINKKVEDITLHAYATMIVRLCLKDNFQMKICDSFLILLKTKNVGFARSVSSMF